MLDLDFWPSEPPWLDSVNQRRLEARAWIIEKSRVAVERAHASWEQLLDQLDEE
jgi:hypothetical protein